MKRGVPMDWDLVSELLWEALQQPEGEREQWVDCQPGVDARTAAEIKSLIRAEARSRAMSGGACGQVEENGNEPTQERSRRFGEYETTRVLGRGGMGVVYLARRVDGEFDQTVALKVIATALHSRELVERFRIERQLLAGLTHPNITRLLDGGVTSEGDPFLVMEYVEGKPLDSYCIAQRLTIVARLRLFLQLCDAVDFAHRNLILHRDLKPSNVLVTADGALKLLDFGTAGLIRPSDAQTQATRARMLTPRYASPAQLRGERSSVADDVFSLGVIFYELLSGSWPFGEPHSMLGELKRATTDARPRPLTSQVTEQVACERGLTRATLSRMLAGDLSAIATKSLENDAERRYKTVAQFAADVRRYLEGRPVEARSQTVVYTTSKFLRRNWLAASAALVFIGGLTAATVFALEQATAAREQAFRAQKINEFLNTMLSSSTSYDFDPHSFTVAEMLDMAVPRIESEWKQDPFVEGTLRISVGDSLAALQKFDSARKQFALAQEIFRKSGRTADEAKAVYGLATTAKESGDQIASVRYYRAALGLLNRMGSKAPALLVFQTKAHLGDVLGVVREQDLDQAEKLVREAIQLREREPSIPASEYLKALTSLGGVLVVRGKMVEAEAIIREAVVECDRIQCNGVRRGLLHYQLVLIHSRRGDYVAARDDARKMYEATLQSIGPLHYRTLWAEMLWARYRAETGEVEAGVTEIEHALPLVRAALPPLSTSRWMPLSCASRTYSLASRFREAEALAREQLEILDHYHVAEIDWRRASSMLELGIALAGENKQKQAAPALAAAAQSFSQLGPAWARDAAQARQRVSDLQGQEVR